MASVESVAGGGTDERTTEFAAATLPHQSKDQSQRGIDLPHLSVGQVTRDLPESLRIHGGCLFDKHSSPSAQQLHLGAKACGQRRRRGRCHQPGGQRQKMRLHDDRKACPRLLNVLYFGGYATGTLHHARSVSVSRRTCAASARSCSFAASAADSERSFSWARRLRPSPPLHHVTAQLPAVVPGPRRVPIGNT